MFFALKKLLCRIAAYTAKQRSRYVRKIALVLMLIFAGPPGLAHLMPAQQGTVNLINNAAFIVMSLPVSALTKSIPQIDENQDGHLSDAELQLHQQTILQQLTRRLRLFDGEQAGKLDFIQINTEPDERDKPTTINPTRLGATQFLILMKVSFPVPPGKLRIETDLFGQFASEQKFAIKATRGQEAEALVLSQHHAQHLFFRSPWQVLFDYIIIGGEHILLGFDHLLFLLTIVVAAAGWRYWLGVLTCFTVAHGITLTLSLTGWGWGLVHVPASIIEPIIAASIVLMAALNLWQRHAAAAQRYTLVFACGLLHGLGFASSIADMGLHGAYRSMSLLGFNLGIELGQAIFLMGVLALGTVWHQLTRTVLLNRYNLTALIKPITSASALIVGTVWMFERLIVY